MPRRRCRPKWPPSWARNPTSSPAPRAATKSPTRAANRWPTSSPAPERSLHPAIKKGADGAFFYLHHLTAAVGVDQGADRQFGRHVHRREELGGALQAHGGDRGNRLVDDVAGAEVAAHLFDGVALLLGGDEGHVGSLECLEGLRGKRLRASRLCVIINQIFWMMSICHSK